jgi:hypothetical protein
MYGHDRRTLRAVLDATAGVDADPAASFDEARRLTAGDRRGIPSVHSAGVAWPAVVSRPTTNGTSGRGRQIAFTDPDVIGSCAGSWAL